MSYLVLARKYRPQKFDELVGQESAATALRNAIEHDRVGQAFLFSGPRGVGKTSMARILAKALNCVKGPTADPCGKCEICKGIESGRDVDIQEIDAATYSKVENIRDLRDTIPYGTLRARYKVLIVDEVHRLSSAAFDALLKVLEEPPPHVKFIFATTEQRKVPETIVSRCQVYEFRRIEEDDIVKALQEICKKEKIKADEALLRAIARQSKGGMRDSLTALDQLIAYAGSSPSLEDLEKCSGMAQSETFYFLLEKILGNERGAILEKLDQLFESGVAEEEFLSQTVEFFRQLMLAKSCGEKSSLLKLGQEERKRLSGILPSLSVDRLDRMITVALLAREKVGYLGGHARILAEIAFLKMARLADDIPVQELLERLSALEQKIESSRGAANPIDPVPVRPSPPSPSYTLPTPKRTEPEKSTDPAKPVSGDLWTSLLNALKAERRSLVEVLARKTKPLGLSGEQFEATVTSPTDLEQVMLRDEKNIAAASQWLSQSLGRPIKFILHFEKSAARSGATAPSVENAGPVTKKAMELFGGRIIGT